jgi:hypothetical protein
MKIVCGIQTRHGNPKDTEIGRETRRETPF